MAKVRFLPKGWQPGPGGYWAYMIKKGDLGFTTREVAIHSGCGEQNTVKSYLRFLINEGFVVRAGDGPWRVNGRIAPVVYKVAIRQVEAPTQRRADYTGAHGQKQQQLWTAMRTLRQFTVAELAFAGSTEEMPVSIQSAKSYVHALKKAGCLIEMKPYRRSAPGAHGARPGTYRLKPSQNTGPKALRVRTLHGFCLFDPNRNEVVDPSATHVSRSAA